MTDKQKKPWFGQKRLVLALIGIALLAGGLLFFMTREPASVPVRVAAVEQRDLRDSITLKAPLEGTETVELVSSLHYEVTEILVKEGDTVKKGQVLAVLDADAMASEIGAAQDALTLAQAQYEDGLRSRQQGYEKAKRSLETAQKELERTEALYDIGGVSAEAREQAQHAVDDAKLALSDYTVKDGMVQSTELERQNVETARHALQRKQALLADGTIVSPIDGIVTRVNIHVGRFADETDDKKPMFVVENLQQLQMQVNVSEYDIADLKAGQLVEISADILKGKKVAGVVERISPTGELKEGSSAERVIPAVIRLTERNDQLIAGINAKAEIILAEVCDALTVPLEAIVEGEDGTNSVMRVNADNKVETIPVTLGLETDLHVQIISDAIQAGDQLILNPEGITDGMTVQTETV